MVKEVGLEDGDGSIRGVVGVGDTFRTSATPLKVTCRDGATDAARDGTFEPGGEELAGVGRGWAVSSAAAAAAVSDDSF